MRNPLTNPLPRGLRTLTLLKGRGSVCGALDLSRAMEEDPDRLTPIEGSRTHQLAIAAIVKAAIVTRSQPLNRLADPVPKEGADVWDVLNHSTLASIGPMPRRWKRPWMTWRVPGQGNEPHWRLALKLSVALKPPWKSQLTPRAANKAKGDLLRETNFEHAQGQANKGFVALAREKAYAKPARVKSNVDQALMTVFAAQGLAKG